MTKSRYTIVNKKLIQLQPSNTVPTKLDTHSNKKPEPIQPTNNIIRFTAPIKQNNYVVRFLIYGLDENDPLPNIVIEDYDPQC